MHIKPITAGTQIKRLILCMSVSLEKGRGRVSCLDSCLVLMLHLFIKENPLGINSWFAVFINRKFLFCNGFVDVFKAVTI